MIMKQTDAILGKPAAINTKMRKSEHSLFFRYDYHILRRRSKQQQKKYIDNLHVQNILTSAVAAAAAVVVFCFHHKTESFP